MQPNDAAAINRDDIEMENLHKTHERWHFHLHPSVTRESAQNSMPKPFQKFFHPTSAILNLEHGNQQLWTSRDHRKNRHIHTSPATNKIRHVDGFWRKLANLRHIEYWNVSWWVAVAFTLGSIVWTVNGFANFLPFCNSHFQTAPNSTGWTAFLGATIFEIGSIFGIWEAWNRDDTVRFGWSVTHALQRPSTPQRNEKDCQPENQEEQKPPPRQWVWFSLNTQYFHELGFLAAFFQLCAASVFWISGFTALPQIQEAIKPKTGVLDGVFWVPQVIGGSGFIISATFIMLESQKKWWKPNVLSLGWQVGVWNMIGGVGFTLSGAFGFAAAANSWAEYQSALSTFWGSWGFLIGSVIQWYESVNSI